VKKGATSVRFSEEQSAALKRIAAAYDVTDVTVVRWAVKALAVHHAQHGQLPPMEIPEAPMILHEPPRAQLKPVPVAAHSKMKTRAR
jgi:hypothetical protein